MASVQTNGEVWKTGALLAAIILHNLATPSRSRGLPVRSFSTCFMGRCLLLALMLSQSAMMRRAAVLSAVAVTVAGIMNA